MIGLLTDPQTGDLIVKDGTLAIGDNTEQVAECVILAARGELKEHPLIGAEITKLINGTRDPLWHSTARQMLEACGIPIRRIQVKDNQITIE